jgi:hypothetical protein
MTLDVSDLGLLDPPRFPGGNKDECDLCSDVNHRGKNCRAVSFVANDFCLEDLDPRSAHVGSPLG